MRTKGTKKQRFLLFLAIPLPVLLSLLFLLLRKNQSLMDWWVFSVLAPVEQLWGRMWSLLPFSMMEVTIALILLGNLFWALRTLVLSLRKRNIRTFLRGVLALASFWLWLLAGLNWLWNTSYYASTFSQRSGLSAKPYSVEELAKVTNYFAQNAARLSTQVERDDQGHFAEDLEACFAAGPTV